MRYSNNYKKNYVVKTNENQYFLSTQESYTTRAICNDETKDILIQSDGYLNVAPACTIISNFFKINAPATHNKTDFIFIKPTLQLSQFDISSQ